MKVGWIVRYIDHKELCITAYLSKIEIFDTLFTRGEFAKKLLAAGSAEVKGHTTLGKQRKSNLGSKEKN